MTYAITYHRPGDVPRVRRTAEGRFLVLTWSEAVEWIVRCGSWYPNASAVRVEALEGWAQ